MGCRVVIVVGLSGYCSAVKIVLVVRQLLIMKTMTTMRTMTTVFLTLRGHL